MAIASESTKELEIKKLAENDESSINPKPAKRTKAPGVRVVHGRIYDSQNGKTCHQCRQKTLDFCADCKNHIKDKQCTLKFCHTCLLNRYGEKAEEVALSEDWSCPKCRGICNCSLCMKKRGHQPTGMLVRTAKASGFSSVSDLLHGKSSEIIAPNMSSKEMGASPRKLASADEESKNASPKKQGKDNLFEGKIKENLNLSSSSSPTKEKVKKVKRGSEEMDAVNGDDTLSKDCSSPTRKKRKNMKPQVSKEKNDDTLQKEISPNLDEKKPNKIAKERLNPKGYQGAHLNGRTRKSPRVTVGDVKEAKSKEVADAVQQEEIVSNTKIDTDFDATDNEIQECMEVLVNREHQNETQDQAVTEHFLDGHAKCLDDEIPLPVGIELTTVAGIELPPRDIGPALQFLEFCATFGKILDVTKGQSEAILCELINGRKTRRGQSTLIVEFQIQLLSLIQKDSGSPPLSTTDGKDSWLSVLKECVHDSYCPLDSLPLDLLDRVGGYDSLDSSMKLRLLNFLCDEVLETAELRTWIEEQNSKFAEETKEAKAKVVAAKHKEKFLGQQMRDSIAKGVVEKNGAPLSIAEHEAIVAQIKQKVAQARAEMLDSESLAIKDEQTSEVVRTEAFHLDSNGCAYWRLKGYSDKSEILGQEIGFRDELQGEEKWFTYDAEQTIMIEKTIKSLSIREGRIRRKIQFQGMAFPTENNDVGLS